MERATRYSRKREAILNAIQSTDCHPSAEWVYQTLKPTHPDLSLGTVYRNLVLFQQQGLIQSIGVVKGQERFDGCIAPHSHLICTCCGAVMVCPIPCWMTAIWIRPSARNMGSWSSAMSSSSTARVKIAKIK